MRWNVETGGIRVIQSKMDLMETWEEKRHENIEEKAKVEHPFSTWNHESGSNGLLI